MSEEFLSPEQSQLIRLKSLIDGNRRTKGGKAKKMPVGQPYVFRKVYVGDKVLLEPFTNVEKIDIEEGDEFVTGYLHEALTVVPKGDE
jgi:hypothetical protein